MNGKYGETGGRDMATNGSQQGMSGNYPSEGHI